MDQDQEELTLTNLGNGGAVELFEEELGKLLENILDPNTDPKAKRKLSLEVTFAPNSDRNEVAIDVACKSKLAPMVSAAATVFVGRRHGRTIAVTHDPRQLQIQWDEESKPRSVDGSRKEA